jgi:hypothetical protein
MDRVGAPRARRPALVGFRLREAPQSYFEDRARLIRSRSSTMETRAKSGRAATRRMPGPTASYIPIARGEDLFDHDCLPIYVKRVRAATRIIPCPEVSPGRGS